MEILLTFGKYGKSAKLKGRNDGNAEMAEISIKYGNRKRRKKSKNISRKEENVKIAFSGGLRNERTVRSHRPSPKKKERRRKSRQKMGNVGKAEILLKYGNKKRQRGGNSRNLDKVRKWEKTEMMKRRRNPCKKTKSVGRVKIWL